MIRIKKKTKNESLLHRRVGVCSSVNKNYLFVYATVLKSSCRSLLRLFFLFLLYFSLLFLVWYKSGSVLFFNTPLSRRFLLLLLRLWLLLRLLLLMLPHQTSNVQRVNVDCDSWELAVYSPERLISFNIYLSIYVYV